MRRRLIRQLSVGTVAVAVAAAATSSAFAASSHGPFGLRPAMMPGGFGPFMGGGPGGFAAGPGFGPERSGVAGPGAGGASILAADVLTPAAAYLGVPVSTLESDLKAGKTLALEASAKGKTAEGLVNAIVASETNVLDAEVSAGWLTSTQESNLISALTSEITDLVNNGPGLPPAGAPRTGVLQTAATYLGMSVGDLQSALQSGKTLADEVASAGSGKTVAGLVAALVAPAKAELDGRVTAGTITQSQETALLDRLTTRLTDLVNGTRGDGSTMQSRLERVIRTALPTRNHG